MSAGENMKFKYCFVLFLILTTIFLLGSVTASENVDLNTNTSDEAYLSIEDVDSKISNPTDVELACAEDKHEEVKSSNDEVDLSVNIELGDIQKTTYGINEITFDVPLVITANVDEGIAKNVKILLIIPEDFEYVSDEKNIGTYKSEIGIWDIGDLNSGISARLTIFTKITTKGNFVISVNGTTDSNDLNLTNNNIDCNIQVSSKITSNTTRTSSDLGGASHETHYASEGNGRQDPVDDGSPEDINNPLEIKTEDSSTDKSNTGKNSNTPEEIGSNGVGNGGSSDSEDYALSRGNAIKEVTPNTISKVAKSIGDTVNNILNQDSNSNEDSGNSFKTVKAISFYNYTQVPLLIFALFFVALIGIYGYDKIKS